MIDFNNVELVVENSYSFVGLVKEVNKLLFYLPKGFASRLKESHTFDSKRNLFFQIYQVLRCFKEVCVEKGYLEARLDIFARDRDGILQGEDGTTIAHGIGESVIFYSKVDWISALLEVYDELKILSLVHRLGRVDRLDLSQLHRYLHQGVFLSNGAVYVDTMNLPRKQVQIESTDIVAMYCYLVVEVKAQLQDEVPPEVTALAERFRQHYLGNEVSLFNERDYVMVLDALKDALNVIDQRTPLKDADYDQFYEAIELFLYGNWQSAKDGKIWGINNFHSVWESMCLTYLVKNVNPSCLLYLDRRFVSDEIIQSVDAATKVIELSSIFRLNGVKLVPDAVVLTSERQYLLAPRQNQIYKLQKDDWNDFNYLTTFSCKSETFDTQIVIAYIGQPTKHHTINELKAFYTGHRNCLLIDSPLPKRFYSYWDIEDDNNLDYHWQAMCQLNHLFYVAFQQGLLTFDAFREQLLKQLGVTSRESLNNNVFNRSMFRSSSLQTIQEKFQFFIRKVSSLNLIDMKYLDIAYFQNDTKVEEIKTRSIRKQFVYEYLLQRFLQKTMPDARLTIYSSFWAPSHNLQKQVLSDGPVYLDGYLDLVKVDTAVVVEHYCQIAPVTEFSRSTSMTTGRNNRQESE